MITLYIDAILSPLNIVSVFPFQKELLLTQCTLLCDPEDSFRFCIIVWVLKEPECHQFCTISCSKWS